MDVVNLYDDNVVAFGDTAYMVLANVTFHPDEYPSYIRCSIENWSLSLKNLADGSIALGTNRMHGEYSPGFDCRISCEVY